MPRSEPFAYYRRRKGPGGAWRRVCECRAENVERAGHPPPAACWRCHKELRPRPTKARQRMLPLEERLEGESALLDEWLAKLSLAVTKIRYYRGRVRQLERQRRLRDAEREERRSRAIRVRPDEEPS